MGLKGSGWVQSSIESARRKLSAKPASNVLPFHSVGIRIRKTITKQVIQRYFYIHGAILLIYEIDNVDDGHGHPLNICKIVPSTIVHRCYTRSYAVLRVTVEGKMDAFP